MSSTVFVTASYSDYVFYIIVSIACLVLLIMSKKEFNSKDLVNSFISLTNKVVLFVIFISSLFAFIFEFLNVEGADVLTFMSDIFNGLLYFCLIVYGVFYLLKLFSWMREFARENDLMYISYFEKKSGVKGDKK